MTFKFTLKIHNCCMFTDLWKNIKVEELRDIKNKLAVERNNVSNMNYNSK